MTGLEILTALLPAAGNVINGISRKFFGSDKQPKAQNPDEWVAMRKADTDRLKALAAIDAPAEKNVSGWVADLRASTRYLIAWAITGAYLFTELTGGASVGLDSATASVWFFLFGERALLKFHGGNK